MNCLSRCCRVFCDLWRSLPFAAALAFSFSILGLTFVSTAEGDVGRALEGIGGEVKTIGKNAHYLTIPFSVVSVVDLWALLLSFIAAGKTRECIFRSRSKRRCNVLCCFQWLVGPCSVPLVEFLVMCLFLLMLVLSYALFIISLVLFSVRPICDAGSDIMTKAEDVFDVVLSKLRAQGDAKAIAIHLDFYCGLTGDLESAGVYAFLGCFLVVLGQAGMMACLAADMDRIKFEMRNEDLEESQPAKTIGRDHDLEKAHSQGAEESWNSIQQKESDLQAQLAKLRADLHEEKEGHKATQSRHSEQMAAMLRRYESDIADAQEIQGLRRPSRPSQKSVPVPVEAPKCSRALPDVPEPDSATWLGCGSCTGRASLSREEFYGVNLS